MQELTLPAPLVLLPGLGADADLFQPQRQAFGDAVHVPDWIDPLDRNESLRSYARRWSESINQTIAGFNADRPWFLGGASMGGMLALEMVPYLDRLPTAVLLIASTRSTPNYPMHIKLGASVVKGLPPQAAAWVLRHSAVPLGVRDGLDDVGYRTLAKMASAADADRYVWSMGAAADWTYPGPPEQVHGQPFPPIEQIHGDRDWMIPLAEAEAPDATVVEHAGHILTLSHYHTVNRWLYDQVLRYCGIDESSEPRVEAPGETVRRRPEVAGIY